jgi:hypothetical protein
LEDSGGDAGAGAELEPEPTHRRNEPRPVGKTSEVAPNRKQRPGFPSYFVTFFEDSANRLN